MKDNSANGLISNVEINTKSKQPARTATKGGKHSTFRKLMIF